MPVAPGGQNERALAGYAERRPRSRSGIGKEVRADKIARNAGHWPAPLASAFGRLARRLPSGPASWALADQMVVSLGNYLTGLILLQAMSQKGYGAFFLVLGAMLLLNGIHGALVAYPLTLHGAVADDETLRRLSGTALRLGFVLSLPCSLLAAAMAALVHGLWLAPWVILATVLWHGQETLRRALMARLRHREALVGDAVRYLGQPLAVLALARFGGLSLESVFAAIAGTALLGLAMQWRTLRPLLTDGEGTSAALRHGWAFGRWLLLSTSVGLLTVQSVPWTLGAFHGVATVADFGALGQVMGLANPLLIGIVGLVVPAVAAAAGGGMASVRRASFAAAGPGVVMLLPLYLLVVAYPEAVLGSMTQQIAYVSLAPEMRLFALGYALALPGQICQAVLNGLGQTRLGLVAQCAFSGATFLFSLPVAAVYGLLGVVWAGLLPGAVFSLVSLVMLRHVDRAASAARSGFVPENASAPMLAGAGRGER